MKSDFHYFFRHIFTKTWNFLHILRRLYQESKRTRSVWQFLWNASTCVYVRAIKREKRTTRVLFPSTLLRHMYVWENLCGNINNSNALCLYDSHIQQTYEQYMYATAAAAAVARRSENNGDTFFNIETSHFWRCSTRNTEADRASYWFSCMEFPWLYSLGDYESKDSKIKGFKEERVSKMGLCKNPCLNN